MRRFRLLFAAIAVLVVVPVGLLLQRAVGSVELERRTRHQAVAERIFDEMERALSEFLDEEEQRPFGQYSHEYVVPGQEGGVRVRSPLADTPRLPFVVGYFQIDPDGSLHTPVRPTTTGDASLAPAVRAMVAELDRTVLPYFQGAASEPARERMAAASQAPGTTVVAGAAGKQRDAKEEAASSVEWSAYDALRALNKGVEQRADRRAKTAVDSAEEHLLAGSRKQIGLADEADVHGRDAAVAPRAEAAKRPASDAPVPLEIMPIVGRSMDAHRLLLYRTVIREAQTYRQGLLVDVDALGGWLRARAFGGDASAAYATVTFGTASAAEPGAEAAAPFVYRHRFAEPCADLSARLALRPLPGVDSAAYVYALCAAVVCAGGLGLTALYRMVAVTVAYAERRSNFVAAVSHELKTPLTAIRMYGEMLRDGIVPAEAKRAEYYRHITAESERLSRLINNVLEFSRLEKGTRQMSLVTAPLGPVVVEAGELLRPHAAREGVALDVEVEEAVPPVRFERDAVLQILFNLVDNAVKYARGGEPKRIILACRALGAAVHVTVRDHGTGVDARHLAKLFAPFYRGENELTRRNTGSGLGLALVRDLAAQMGARAVARNLPEGGFEVAVVFPIPRA